MMTGEWVIPVDNLPSDKCEIAELIAAHTTVQPPFDISDIGMYSDHVVCKCNGFHVKIIMREGCTP